MLPLRTRAADYFRSLQDSVCSALEALDGAVFEKAGVNFSEVFGQM